MNWTHDHDEHLTREILADPPILSHVNFKLIYIWLEKEDLSVSQGFNAPACHFTMMEQYLKYALTKLLVYI